MGRIHGVQSLNQDLDKNMFIVPQNSEYIEQVSAGDPCVNFCHWLQGFFDHADIPPELNPSQIAMIKEKLDKAVVYNEPMFRLNIKD
jgi:hypothetical protein